LLRPEETSPGDKSQGHATIGLRIAAPRGGAEGNGCEGIHLDPSGGGDIDKRLARKDQRKDYCSVAKHEGRTRFSNPTAHALELFACPRAEKKKKRTTRKKARERTRFRTPKTGSLLRPLKARSTGGKGVSGWSPAEGGGVVTARLKDDWGDGIQVYLLINKKKKLGEEIEKKKKNLEEREQEKPSRGGSANTKTVPVTSLRRLSKSLKKP